MGFIKSVILSSVPGIVHGFGDSGSTDSTDEIAERFALRGIGRLRQVHGSGVIFAEDIRAAGEDLTEGDALVAGARGFGAAVSTADCVPILLSDREGRVAAAIHAGWRGTLAGIAVSTLRRIDRRYGIAPSRIYAAIGPSIKRCCYEVGEDVAASFREKYGDAGGYLEEKGGSKYILDLPLANRRALESAGVGEIEILGPCTRCDSNYYSYRRHGKGVGSQLSFIGMI